MNPCPLTSFDEVAELNMSAEGGKGGKALHLGSHPIYSARDNYIKPSCASIIFFSLIKFLRKEFLVCSPCPPTPPFSYSTTKPFILIKILLFVHDLGCLDLVKKSPAFHLKDNSSTINAVKNSTLKILKLVPFEQPYTRIQLKLKWNIVI